MPSLQIINLPQDIYNKLQLSAERNHRSMTLEAVTLLENALMNQEQKSKKMEALQNLKKFRKHFVGITAEDVICLIRDDRDK